jgi:hypothetical protein
MTGLSELDFDEINDLVGTAGMLEIGRRYE